MNTTSVIKKINFIGTIVVISVMVVCSYKIGYSDADKNWKRKLIEKNLIGFDVSTNYVTNYTGQYIWKND